MQAHPAHQEADEVGEIGLAIKGKIRPVHISFLAGDAGF
jgi:hypothetical protein